MENIIAPYIFKFYLFVYLFFFANTERLDFLDDTYKNYRRNDAQKK
jgi:hypothetical protein